LLTLRTLCSLHALTGNTVLKQTAWIVRLLFLFNSRLGALGFLVTDDFSGNFGIKDQREVLKWVARNIRNFGGDPSSITVFGGWLTPPPQMKLFILILPHSVRERRSAVDWSSLGLSVECRLIPQGNHAEQPFLLGIQGGTQGSSSRRRVGLASRMRLL